MNIENEIKKINHDSILDFDLKLNDNDISNLDYSEVNRIDSLLDYDSYYDFQFNPLRKLCK